MMNAFEAKRTSRENKMKIEAKKLERLIKDIESKILVSIENGWGYIEINSGLSCLSEIATHFDALGYETLHIHLDLTNEERVYIIWDQEAWTKELGIEEKRVKGEN